MASLWFTFPTCEVGSAPGAPKCCCWEAHVSLMRLSPVCSVVVSLSDCPVVRDTLPREGWRREETLGWEPAET